MGKKILSVLLIFAFLFTSAVVFADVNVDGGDGGEMGDAETGCGWTPGNDGLRVTIVRIEDRNIMRPSVDFSNNPQNNVGWYCGYKSKLRYRSEGLSIITNSIYVSKRPETPLPQIISPSGGSNVAAIKSYFSTKGSVQYIANLLDFPYEELINGEYVLLIEPVAYFKYYGKKVAMTATEAALFDFKVSGDLRKKMGHLTHQNMPLSMFLEKAALGYSAWGGPQSGFVADNDILNYLGLGLVSFKELPDEGDGTGGIPKDKDYIYRCDTDVITSVWVRAGQDNITPDDNARVTFNIGGRILSQEFVMPKGEKQLAWVRWHTPKEPCEISVSVGTSHGSIAQGKISIAVMELKEKTPPNPMGTDRNDRFVRDRNVKSFGSTTMASWGEWWATWIANWQWHENLEWDEDLKKWVDNGDFVDDGDWDYKYRGFSAKLSSKGSDLIPDEHCPTATKDNGIWCIKSGYGWQLDMPVSVSYSSSLAVTPVQNAMAFFPEFNYLTYNRILDGGGSYVNNFKFKSNPCSQWESPTHFTPIWYPDDRYDVATVAFDCWTPAGQLYISSPAKGSIDGDVYDDWHIGPTW